VAKQPGVATKQPQRPNDHYRKPGVRDGCVELPLRNDLRVAGIDGIALERTKGSAVLEQARAYRCGSHQDEADDHHDK